MKSYYYIIFVALFLSVISCQIKTPYPFILKRGKIFASDSHYLSFIDDLDENAYSEVILIERNPTGVDYRILIKDLETDYHIYSEPIWRNLIDVKAYDLTGNGRKEILYTYQAGDSMFLKIYDPFANGKVLLHEKLLIGRRRFVSRPWVGRLCFQETADLNHDSHPDLLMLMGANYDRYPRGIMAYDVYHHKKLWQFYTGPQVHDVQARDLNNDGYLEVFFGTRSPGNGARVNNTDDFHIYFIVLDEKGNRIFQKVMAGENAELQVIFGKMERMNKESLITLTSTTNSKFYEDISLVRWDWTPWPQFKPKIVNDALKISSKYAILPFQGTPHLFAPDMEGQ